MTNVGLRDLRPDDRDRLLAWRNAPEVARYMYTDRPITPEEHVRWFESAPGDPRRRYWIIELEGEPVGLANLYDIDLDQGRCAWAFYLAEPSVRGKGVGAYVEYWVLQHVFETMGLHKLWCEVLESNEGVWKMHQRHGFQIEARLRDHVKKGGAFETVLGLGLLKDDWAAVREGCAQRLRRAGLSPH